MSPARHRHGAALAAGTLAVGLLLSPPMLARPACADVISPAGHALEAKTFDGLTTR